MSALTDLIYAGSNAVAGLTDGAVKEAIEKYGEDIKIAFPETAYFFPTIYAATGVKVEKLSDLPACVGVLNSLITNEDDIGAALNAGLATAVGAEILEGLKYLDGADPYADEAGIGFVPDKVIRSLGVPLVTGDIPGVAVVLGKSENAAEVAEIIKDYQAKGILTFLIGDVIDQIVAEDVKIGLEYRVVPLGHSVTAVIHAVTVAVRAALIFGNLQPGDLPALLAYTKERVPAFVNTFGPLDEVTVSAGAGAIALGFPVVADIDLGDMQVSGALESETDYSNTSAKSLEMRNIKVKQKDIELPVAYASAFEGEVIRRGDMYAEVNSISQPAFELVVTKDVSEVEDHAIILDGPQFEGEGPLELSMAVIIEVAGKNMEEDFEPVIERKVHHWFNYLEGVMHTGQRNIIRVRVSKEAHEKGLELRHFGEVIHAMVMDEFEAVVDECQIKIITDPDKVTTLLDELAMPRYIARDDRLASMTDESVDTFYTCTLCQSFAPAHVCVVTPERLGLCGAVSWLDAKATKELEPNGACQPVQKKDMIDERLGIYGEINKTIEDASHGHVGEVSLYSILVDPMTSCGCFECICGIIPEANGVAVVSREYVGITPTGMTFGELASMTGGGVQTPGFMGHGRHFISSKKFLHAEGGLERIVWMPKELKDDIADRLNKTAKEMYGIDNFTDMICDETIADESEGMMAFLEEKHHPALAMEPLM